MSFFQGLSEEIKRLNSDVKNVANSEKAQALKKKLLKIGLPMTIGGFLGVFVCFILFATAGDSAFTSTGFSARVIIPWILIIPCAIVGGIGSTLLSLGFKIMVTGYSAKLVDETVGNCCPNCGDKVDEDEMYCSKCGKAVKTKCSSCGCINNIKNTYCKQCGNKLETN